MCVFQVNSLLVLMSHTKYILGLLQFHHDFLLDELQIHLHEFRNLDVSISTIQWHAMKNAGLTWKKVCTLRKVNMCKYPPIGSIIILPYDVYKSSKIILPKEGFFL